MEDIQGIFTTFLISIPASAFFYFLYAKYLVGKYKKEIEIQHEENRKLKFQNHSLHIKNNDNAEHIEVLHRAVDEEYDKKVRRNELISFLKANKIKP